MIFVRRNGDKEWCQFISHGKTTIGMDALVKAFLAGEVELVMLNMEADPVGIAEHMKKLGIKNDGD